MLYEALKIIWATPEKKQTVGTYFFEIPPPPPPRSFSFIYFTQEIPDKSKLHAWKLCKFVLHPLEIPRQKTKTPGNST